MAIRNIERYIAQCDKCGGGQWNNGEPPYGITPGHAANLAAQWSTELGKGMLCVPCRRAVAQRLRTQADELEAGIPTA